MAHDREVAGIRCMEVLGELSNYLDDELDAGRRAQVEAHLRGCGWCQRFGTEMAATVKSLRRQLTRGVDGDVEDRLMARLDTLVPSND